MSFTHSLDEKTKMIKMYLDRDFTIDNADSVETRQKYMYKLGYTTDKIDAYKKRRQDSYMLNMFKKMYSEYLDYQTNHSIDFKELEKKYLLSDEYQEVNEYYNHSLSRMEYLQPFLEKSNEEFYNELTIQELMRLGY